MSNTKELFENIQNNLNEDIKLTKDTKDKIEVGDILADNSNRYIIVDIINNPKSKAITVRDEKDWKPIFSDPITNWYGTTIVKGPFTRKDGKIIKESDLNETVDYNNCVYQLVGGDYEGVYSREEAEKLPIKEDKLSLNYSDARNSGALVPREELDDQLQFEGYLGPMYNGTDRDGKHVIRYETQEVYDMMSESALNEGKPDFIVFTNDKLTDYDANIKKLNSRIRRMKVLSKYHPEYKEQVDKLRKELKQTKQDRESYANSEEFKDEKEKYFNSTNESALNEDKENDNVKVINIWVSDEHKEDRESDKYYDPDVIFYGYATISTDKLGEFMVSFDCTNYKLTDEQINFINSHKTKLSNLIRKADNNGGSLKESSLEDVRKDSKEKGLLSEDYNPLNVKLFMNTWGNYNVNGADTDSIGGGWMDIDQAREFLEAHSEEEPFINDTNGDIPFEVNEYSNVEQVLDWLEQYENLSENDREAFTAIMEDQNDDFESAMNILESGDYVFFSGVETEEELGEAWVDMVGGIEGVSNPENYVDEEAYRESWRDAAEESVRDDNPDIDEDSDEFESLVEEWLDAVVPEQLQLDIDEGRDLSEYFDYKALGRDLDSDGFFFATTGAIQTL